MPPQAAHRCKQPVRNPATSSVLQNLVKVQNPETAPSGEEEMELARLGSESTCYPGEKKKVTLQHLA